MTAKEPKAPKPKKRLSDFEIFRTIFQRTSERKLPYLLRNLGADSDIYFLSSHSEEDFVYGSSVLSIGMIEITDPELKAIVESFMVKMYGCKESDTGQLIVNIKEQISELAKTKGESLDSEVETNEHGAAWIRRYDINQRERIINYVSAIESLYHFQTVQSWCEQFRPLMTTDDPNHVYVPFKYQESGTSTITNLDLTTSTIVADMFGNGIAPMITKGIDVIMSKSLEDLPYKVLSEEIIFFKESGSAHKMLHRIRAEGWNMIVLRPNAVYIPPRKIES